MSWMLTTFFIGMFAKLSQSYPTIQSSSTAEWEKSLKDLGELVYPQLHSTDGPVIKYPISSNHHVLVLKTSSETFYIDLKPNDDLLKTNAIDGGQSKNSCHFHGNVISHGDAVAAISICDSKGRMSGTIIVGNEAYILRPLDQLEGKENHPKFQNASKNRGVDPHVMSKLGNSVTPFCGVEGSGRMPDVKDNEISSPQRLRRSTSQQDPPRGYKVIETAIYVDHSLYRKFITEKQKSLAELQDTILTTINQVQVIFNYRSLNQKFKIVIVQLKYLTEGEDAPDPSDGNIDEYLETFCAWQETRNPPTSSEKHWDHAIMLTGYDLYKLSDGKKNFKVLGLAWLNGMCRPNHSCTLEEGSTFQGSFVIAHEMGHSLGMFHDGVKNKCDPESYIMADKTGPGRITWSTCSRDYLEAFFRKGHGRCLEDGDSHILDVNAYKFDDQLPGHRFDLEDQCKLSFGKDYRPHVSPKYPFDNVCRQLWCKSVSGLWASLAHPALEGSSCGEGMHCIQGKCKGGLTNDTVNKSSVADVQMMLVDFLDKLKMAFQFLLP